MNGHNRIIAFHLLNDRSGSPKVLSQILKSWAQEGKDVLLYTTTHRQGFLSDISGIKYVDGWYRFQTDPWFRLVNYSLSQIILFCKMFFVVKKTDIIYINTVLPFGAAILGKLKGAIVIYHIHESTVNPAILKWFLFKIVTTTANDIINVSNYVATSHGIVKVSNHLIYNSIDELFLKEKLPKEHKEIPNYVLMICSLKIYKGVFEYLQLAYDNPRFKFRLILNANQSEIETFFKGSKFPENLEVYPSQKNLHPFYQWADLIINLSRPDGWIETFGLTIIEGMAYGLPAIVPPVGGILEVIIEGETGYSVDSRNRDALNEKLKLIMDNPLKYKTFSNTAIQRLELFKEQNMLNSIKIVLRSQR